MLTRGFPQSGSYFFYHRPTSLAANQAIRTQRLPCVHLLERPIRLSLLEHLAPAGVDQFALGTPCHQPSLQRHGQLSCRPESRLRWLTYPQTKRKGESLSLLTREEGARVVSVNWWKRG